MQKRRAILLSRTIGYVVLTYGLVLVASTLLRQLQIHRRHSSDTLFTALPLLIGLGYVYLATLLLRLKYNAWLTACVLSAGTIALSAYGIARHIRPAPHGPVWLRLLIPVLLLAMLLASKRLYRVRSDMRSFTQALRASVIILLVALLYGVGGFTLLDEHDFHQEISVLSAVHQTVDQFGLTTRQVAPHSRRAVLFVDSLSAISLGAVAYVGLAFFQPVRQNLTGQNRQRRQAEALLRKYPGDADDYFKLWPHDKHYLFDQTAAAGLAYHVNRGVALVVGDPFGDPERFEAVLGAFGELCFVNDWTPSFIHVGDRHAALYTAAGYGLQKIGEEAHMNVADWPATQTGKRGKYFREIRNRFDKAGYEVALLRPPYDTPLLKRLRTISDNWLQKPGRAERGFMLGYHDDTYLNQCDIAVVRDDKGTIQGFMNLVPTFEPGVANYDLLRCSDTAPGNCNDYLLMGVLDWLSTNGYATLNLGLSPLSGLDNVGDDKTVVDTALGFLYANAGRLYSFSGLRRYKDKYQPSWEPRYIAYRGSVATFTRVAAALNRAMKIK